MYEYLQEYLDDFLKNERISRYEYEYEYHELMVNLSEGTACVKIILPHRMALYFPASLEYERMLIDLYFGYQSVSMLTEYRNARCLGDLFELDKPNKIQCRDILLNIKNNHIIKM